MTIPFSVSDLVAEARRQIREVEPRAFAEAPGGAVVIDVRLVAVRDGRAVVVVVGHSVTVDVALGRRAELRRLLAAEGALEGAASEASRAGVGIA